MMSMVQIIALSVLAYIIGSIPNGLIISKVFYKKDIREFGSHNIGATNVYRTLGIKPAVVVFLLDLLKGGVGVLLFAGTTDLVVLGGILAMIGHNWPIFLGFKGGRGVATGLGVLVFMVPVIALIVFLVWGLIVYFTRYVSLGSVIAAVLVPLLMIILEEPIWYIAFGFLAAFFVVFRHRSNISRLYHGTESKVGKQTSS